MINGTVTARFRGPYLHQGYGVQLTNHITATLGTGGAVVNLTTVNGSITVTGQ